MIILLNVAYVVCLLLLGELWGKISVIKLGACLHYKVSKKKINDPMASNSSMR